MNTQIYRFRLGNFACMAVRDGTFAYPDHSFFVNAPDDERERVLREHDILGTEITAPWLCLLVDTGQHRVLVDTGGGAGSVPTAGRLLENLKAEGIEPGDIETVILSHAHPDHIGGNTDVDGEPIFAHARHVMSRDEWDFWTSGPDLSKLPVGEELRQLMLACARKNLPPIKARLELVDRETEILPGIKAVPAPGHTPGHMALTISSGTATLLYLSDAVIHPIHLLQPEWHPAFDLAPEQAKATRRQLLDRVAAERVMTMACHFPYPGLGHVIKGEYGWQWQPISIARPPHAHPGH